MMGKLYTCHQEYHMGPFELTCESQEGHNGDHRWNDGWAVLTWPRRSSDLCRDELTDEERAAFSNG